MRQTEVNRLGKWRVAGAVAVLLAGAAGALPAAAQPADATALTESLKRLESNPRDVEALVTAGRATLAIGDIPSAAAFFGRAAEVSPSDPRVLGGLGSLSATMNQPDKALDLFAQAAGAGARDADIGAGRGLAFDLTGNREAAESNYRAALRGPDAAEAARRLALNLAMAGDRTGALALINPQIAAGDADALRTRAFVLALTGDTDNARRAIESAMPGAGDAIDPFLRQLPRLSDRQKAAAVHLGVFPTENEVEYASNAPQADRGSNRADTRRAAPSSGRPTRSLSQPSPPVATASRSSAERDRLIDQVGRSNTPTDPPEKRSQPRYRLDVPTDAQLRAGGRVRRIRIDDGADPAEVSREAERRSAAVARSAPIATTPIAQNPIQTTPVAAAPAVTSVPLPPAEDIENGRLASIDRLLASDPNAAPSARPGRVENVAVPAAPRPKYDAPAPPRPKVDAPPPPRPKVEAARPAAASASVVAATSDIGVAGTHFVQLAGSENRGAMSFEWKRLQKKAGGALDGQDALLTNGVSFHRLLLGPFDSRAEAQAMVSKLRAQGVDSFAWTRNPSALRIDRL